MVSLHACVHCEPEFLAGVSAQVQQADRRTDGRQRRREPEDDSDHNQVTHLDSHHTFRMHIDGERGQEAANADSWFPLSKKGANPVETGN